MTCAFCPIITEPDTAGAHVVLVTPTVVAFLDRSPLFAGHTLVVPRRHVATFSELVPDEVADIFGAAQRVTAALPLALGCQGAFVALNDVVSQSVPHVHVHVVPRAKGDGLRGFFWPRRRYGEGEAAATADRLRAALS
jgi:histidine triad (HIT) family protein